VSDNDDHTTTTTTTTAITITYSPVQAFKVFLNEYRASGIVLYVMNLYVCMYVCMYVCIYVCMYVYMCI